MDEELLFVMEYFYIDVLLLLLKDLNISSTPARRLILCPWPDIKKAPFITSVTLQTTKYRLRPEFSEVVSVAVNDFLMQIRLK